APATVRVDGDRVVALGGGEGTGVEWRSVHRGESCTRVVLPPLFVRGASPGPFSLALDGDVALLWNAAGALARSDDVGASWHRLADLPGIVEAAPGPGHSVLAAVQVNAGAGRRRVRFFQLQGTDAQFWAPLD